MNYLFMGLLIGFLGNHFGLSFANQTVIWLIQHIFFAEVVKEFGFCPNLLRTDAGTENGIMTIIGGIPNQLFCIPDYFSFQSCVLEDINNVEVDINNIDGIANVTEQCYGGANNTETRRACGYFQNILQNKHFGFLIFSQLLLKFLTFW